MHIMILHFFWLKSNVMLAFSQNMKFYEPDLPDSKQILFSCP